MLVSECCGAPVRGNSDDMGLCTNCRDHCEYINDEDDDDNSPSKEEITTLYNNVGYYNCQQILINSWHYSPRKAREFIDNVLKMFNLSKDFEALPLG